ncbi:MAG: hypothetical protein LBK56_04075 [Gracilibacteraceae bacterium]|jgi:maleate isomerase|nr:hypothetical protein [Gracilibacteraceae bacterium]
MRKPRVGLVVPSVQTVTESLYHRLFSDDFEFVTQRMRLLGGKPEDLQAMEADAPSAIAALRDADVDAILYCCTGSSAVQGFEKERTFCQQMEALADVPFISTMTSCVKALRRLDAKTINMVTPNDPGVRELEEVYLQKVGFKIVKSYGFGITDGKQFAYLTPESIAETALNGWDADADALFLSCMNWHATKVMFEIWNAISKPVVTSHSASIWEVWNTLVEDVDYESFSRKHLAKQIAERMIEA